MLSETRPALAGERDFRPNLRSLLLLETRRPSAEGPVPHPSVPPADLALRRRPGAADNAFSPQVARPGGGPSRGENDVAIGEEGGRSGSALLASSGGRRPRA